MCYFLCFKKFQKKNKNDDILLYSYKTCQKCKITFKSDKHYSNHLYTCYLDTCYLDGGI